MTADVSVIHDGGPPTDASRRDFLKLVTLATAAIGGAAIAWAFIDSMNPAADVIAAGAPIDVDLSKLTPGQQIVILWRGSPILVVNRTQDALKNPATAEPHRAPERSEVNSHAAAGLCRELAPVDQAGVCGIGRRLHTFGLPAILLSQSKRDRPGRELAWRILLPMPWLEVRFGRSGLYRCSGALQPAGAALSLSQRARPADRRKSKRDHFCSQLGGADVAVAEMNKV